jgi:hypothetical protein
MLLRARGFATLTERRHPRNKGAVNVTKIFLDLCASGAKRQFAGMAMTQN